MRIHNLNRQTFPLLMCALAMISTIFAAGAFSHPVFADDTLRPEILVEPLSQSTTAGGYGNYKIRIRQQGSANIFLATKGVPPSSTAIFSQDRGLAVAELNSTLTILTSSNTPVTTYRITVIALINGQEYDAPISLQVTSATITTQNNSTTTTSATGLSLTMSSDKYRYAPNATVYLRGHVTDLSGNVIANANAAVQVDSPTGVEVVLLKDLQTDAAGAFQASFTFPLHTQAGTYTTFASASKQGYIGATTRTTFVVESSSTPSVVIQTVYTGDNAGNQITIFSPGQTVYVWVVLGNVGSTFQGVIWVQVRDPNGALVQILMRSSTLTSGQTFKDDFGFTLTAKPTTGLYTVNALVSDNMISQGGVFLANSSTQFAVTSS